MKVLLDTHVLLWWFDKNDRLPGNYRQVIEQASPKEPLMISTISLWEIATLHDLGRIRLTLPLREWLEQATAPPLVRRCELSPAVATEVAALPATFHRDPADRIIVATSRLLGATLLSCDRQIMQADVVTVLPPQ